MQRTFIDLAFSQVGQDFKTNLAKLERRRQNGQGYANNLIVCFCVFVFLFWALVCGIYQFIIVVLKVCALILFAIQFEISGMIQRKRGIYYVCQSHDCSYRGEPIYICPQCGAVNHLLRPNSYGLFHHKCVDCDNMLPTLAHYGKDKLEKCCGQCKSLLSQDAGKLPVRQIWIAGDVMSGQTCYLLMAVRQILEGQSWIQGKFEDPYGLDYLNSESQGFDTGIPADKSVSESNFLLHSKIMESECLLSLHGAPGENFYRIDGMRSIHNFDIMEGFILMVDPMPFFAAESKERYDAGIGVDTIAENVLNRICMERHQGDKKIPMRVAVVISKADIDWVTSQIGDVREKVIPSETCRQALVNWGCGKIIKAFELNFEHVQYFACSALGRESDYSDRTPFQGFGVLEPLKWILTKQGKVVGFKQEFIDFWKPGWKHPDPKMRVRTVSRMTSKVVLMDVYEHDEDVSVRLAVVDRLKDQALLTGIAENDTDGNVRLAAVSNLSGLALVYVAPGSFQMGSNDSDSYRREKPVYHVTISQGYGIGKYPVTQSEYRSIMDRNPSYFKGGNNPVEQVSWHDAVKYCEKLTARERAAGRLPSGYEYRLPTEAEWEFAARGGVKSRGYKYSGSDNLTSVAWYNGNSGNKNHKVGTKAPNELGIYDMSGNVWEWCRDWYDSYSSDSQVDPAGPDSGSSRVNRGGSWDNNAFAGACRVAYRDFNSPGYADDDLGFRVAFARSSL
jgi:formylglycine-generating enzyme required for sulfatase activity